MLLPVYYKQYKIRYKKLSVKWPYTYNQQTPQQREQIYNINTAPHVMFNEKFHQKSFWSHVHKPCTLDGLTTNSTLYVYVISM